MKKLFVKLCVLLLLPMLVLTVGAEGFDYSFAENSKALLLVNLDADKVAFAKNPDERLPMASLTKIMSYIVAYEMIPDIANTVITVDQSVMDILEATNSSTAGIVAGEQFTGLQLLHLMMVCSGNDAALVLAQYVDELNGIALDFTGETQAGIDARAVNMAGSAFVARMNQKAAELGCTNTNFTNPHGLHHVDHYTTAREMAVITKYALTMPYFMEVCSSKTYTLAPTNMYDTERTFLNTNRMMHGDSEYYYPQTNGIKTGSLNESGYCLVTTAQNEESKYLVVALGSPMLDAQGVYVEQHGEMLDARTLFTWAFANIKQLTVAHENSLQGELPLAYCWGKESLSLSLGADVTALLATDYNPADITVEKQLPEKAYAPIVAGDVIGSAVFSYKGEPIGTSSIVAAENAERNLLLATFGGDMEILGSPVFIGIACIMGVAFLLVITAFAKGKKKPARRRRRR